MPVRKWIIVAQTNSIAGTPAPATAVVILEVSAALLTPWAINPAPITIVTSAAKVAGETPESAMTERTTAAFSAALSDKRPSGSTSLAIPLPSTYVDMSQIFLHCSGPRLAP